MFSRSPDIRRDNRRDWTPGNLFDFLDTFWREPFSSITWDSESMNFPAINISENDSNIEVKAELPGMEAKDVDISLQNDNLILEGEKKFEDEKNQDNYYRIERSYGKFYRTIPLSTQIDESKVKAQMKNGVLELTLPKKEPSVGGAKKIAIKS